MIKIVLTGPESTGKTTLAETLAEYYHTVWVPEYAREYLQNLGRSYKRSDLLEICKGQLRLEKQLSAEANRVLFCDTGPLVIKIWSEYKYGFCDPQILQHFLDYTCDLYLLPDCDVPFVRDPMRESGGIREPLFQRYQEELQTSQLPFFVLSGSLTKRMEQAISQVDALLISST